MLRLYWKGIWDSAVNVRYFYFPIAPSTKNQIALPGIVLVAIVVG